MKRRIGIMQGRLSPRPPGKLQEFPKASWRAEFELAAALGFDAIEWIYEADGAALNPLMTEGGRREIRRVIDASGVPVRSICGDYFMVERLAGDGADAVERNCQELERVIDAAAELGAERILLPLLETAAVDTPELRAEVTQSLRRVAPRAAAANIVLGLEMEIAGPQYAALLEAVDHPNVRAYYDVGNSTAQGFDVATDIEPLLPWLFAVHVKDRRRRSTSVQLGTGDANFAGFFKQLKSRKFTGDLVLQHYFDTDPRGAAQHALSFIRELWPAEVKSS